MYSFPFTEIPGQKNLLYLKTKWFSYDSTLRWRLYFVWFCQNVSFVLFTQELLLFMKKVKTEHHTHLRRYSRLLSVTKIV